MYSMAAVTAKNISLCSKKTHFFFLFAEGSKTDLVGCTILLVVTTMYLRSTCLKVRLNFLKLWKIGGAVTCSSAEPYMWLSSVCWRHRCLLLDQGNDPERMKFSSVLQIEFSV